MCENHVSCTRHTGSAVGLCQLVCRANSTATAAITVRKWEMIVQTTTTTVQVRMAYELACSESSPMACGVQTYLNNHHYNRPYTCFRPDLAGQYSLTLSATDGCVTNSATASITARCGTPPSISFTSQQAVQLSGRVFTRVALTAAVCTHVDTHAMLRHSQILKKV